MPRSIVAAIAVTLIALAGTSAHATAYFRQYHSGIECQPATGWASPYYTEAGVYNTDVSNAHSVVCAAPHMSITSGTDNYKDVSGIWIYYTDQNASFNGGLSCYVFEYTSGGALYYGSGGTKHSCDTPGGCYTAFPPFATNLGYLSWTSPFNSGNPTGQSSVSGIACTIPSHNSTYASAIVGYLEAGAYCPSSASCT